MENTSSPSFSGEEKKKERTAANQWLPIMIIIQILLKFISLSVLPSHLYRLRGDCLLPHKLLSQPIISYTEYCTHNKLFERCSWLYENKYPYSVCRASWGMVFYILAFKNTSEKWRLGSLMCVILSIFWQILAMNIWFDTLVVLQMIG